jgi:hypothetical protein
VTRPELGADGVADEADVLEQQRELRADAEPEEQPGVALEADEADLAEQSRSVPAEEEEWPDA